MLLTEFATIISERIRAEHAVLAARWFERLADLLPVAPGDVFPTDSLLDHIPALIVHIGDYIGAPEEDAIAANTAVLEKARELGALRHEQRASLHQVLREYQVLGGILTTFVKEEITRLMLAPPPSESITVASRLAEAVNVLTQTTVETFVSLYTRTISEQAERLEEFTRIATHEWRQPLGSLQFAVALLREADSDPVRTKRAVEVMERNITHLVDVTRKVEALARIGERQDDPVAQAVSVSAVASQAARQLRDMADARGVELRVTPDLPTITTDVGRLELIFINLMSNGIKYADPGKQERFVEVALAAPPNGTYRIHVRDNGIGIPPAHLASIFERFSRAHADDDQRLNVSGLGLGLSIVRDCLRSIGGSIAVESSEGEGSRFVLTLPAGD